MEKFMSCRVCRKEFSTHSVFQDHHYRCTYQRKKIECKLCLKKLSRRSWDFHMDRDHNPKIMSCRICRKEFASLNILQLHQEIHSVGKKVPCNLCTAEFKSDKLLKHHHVNVHSEKTFRCKSSEYCNYSASRKVMLTNHIKQHHENNKYYCEVKDCDYVSKTTKGLSYHKNLKHGKSYKCSDCEYVCQRSDYLKRHRRSVHDNVRYPCDMCDYQATRRQYLNSHIKVIHKLKSDP